MISSNDPREPDPNDPSPSPQVRSTPEPISISNPNFPCLLLSPERQEATLSLWLTPCGDQIKKQNKKKHMINEIFIIIMIKNYFEIIFSVVVPLFPFTCLLFRPLGHPAETRDACVKTRQPKQQKERMKQRRRESNVLS